MQLQLLSGSSDNDLAANVECAAIRSSPLPPSPFTKMGLAVLESYVKDILVQNPLLLCDEAERVIKGILLEQHVLKGGSYWRDAWPLLLAAVKSEKEQSRATYYGVLVSLSIALSFEGSGEGFDIIQVDEGLEKDQCMMWRNTQKSQKQISVYVPKASLRLSPEQTAIYQTLREDGTDPEMAAETALLLL